MADDDGVVIISSDPPSPLSPHPPPSLPFELDDSDIDFDADLDRIFKLPPEFASPMSPVLRPESEPAAEDEGPSPLEAAVLSCFPDICPDYLKSQAANHDGDPQRLITYILDEEEKGKPYPKRPSPAKRKRQLQEEEQNEEEEMRRKFMRADPRLASKDRGYVKAYTKTAKALLKASFSNRYSEDIDNILKENDYQLYPTYVALDTATWNPAAGPIRYKKCISRREHPEELLRLSRIEGDMDALAAFDAARAACQAKAEARRAKEAEERDEAENLRRAQAEGAVADCGCCYEEKPLNRMVHCNGDPVHWFCCPCAKQMAEHVVGASKYQLICMSMDGCDATFSMEQRALFLDDKLTRAIELIEQEAVLRMAGIENLATCPFCNYAAEYPPVEENKEFRCEAPDCGLVSCRLCREETHVPKSCEESARERGISARRAIEEAMSAALIRKCNKCGTPFIKENGCNKMTCTRAGCRNVQCYVCSKSCDYSHFDDSTRGGKKGNCPLFDSVEERHQDEVRAAEEEARKKVAEANPSVDADMLKINFSENVKLDDERRKAANPGPRHPPGMARVPQQPLVGAPWAQQNLQQHAQNMAHIGHLPQLPNFGPGNPPQPHPFDHIFNRLHRPQAGAQQPAQPAPGPRTPGQQPNQPGWEAIAGGAGFPNAPAYARLPRPPGFQIQAEQGQQERKVEGQGQRVPQQGANEAPLRHAPPGRARLRRPFAFRNAAEGINWPMAAMNEQFRNAQARGDNIAAGAAIHARSAADGPMALSRGAGVGQNAQPGGMYGFTGVPGVSGNGQGQQVAQPSGPNNPQQGAAAQAQQPPAPGRALVDPFFGLVPDFNPHMHFGNPPAGDGAQ